MTVDPDHLKFTHLIRLRSAPMLINTVEEAIDYIDAKSTPTRVYEALRDVREELYRAIEHESQEEADQARDRMVNILDGLKFIHRL